MIGLSTHSDRTLLDRALELLGGGPCGPDRLSREVFGITQAPPMVMERLAIALLGADPRVRQLDDGRWVAVAEAQESPLLEECTFAVVDVETTGMRARGDDRVTDIAVVLVRGARRELIFESLVNPGCPIPPRIALLTGITNAMVQQAPPFRAVVEQLLAALAGRVFVAHNVHFDWGFLTAEIRRARDLILVGPRLCTVRLARRLLPHLESRSLDRLSLFFDLQNPARHRAAGDALATADLLVRLLGMAREQGVRTLGELQGLTLRKQRGAGRTPREPQ